MSSVPNLENYCVLFLVYVRLTNVAVAVFFGFDTSALSQCFSHFVADDPEL